MTDDINEYRIRVSVRNNLLLTAIEKQGYKSVSAFCKANDILPQNLNRLTSLRETPINTLGEFSPLAVMLMDILDALPTDLWTAEQLTFKLKRNTAERSVSMEGMRAALGMNADEALALLPPPIQPDEVLESKELKGVVDEMLESMGPKEARVIRMRFGIGCEEHTLEEIARSMDVTRERIRQIEAKALRKFKVPERRKILDPYLEDDS